MNRAGSWRCCVVSVTRTEDSTARLRSLPQAARRLQRSMPTCTASVAGRLLLAGRAQLSASDGLAVVFHTTRQEDDGRAGRTAWLLLSPPVTSSRESCGFAWIRRSRPQPANAPRCRQSSRPDGESSAQRARTQPAGYVPAGRAAGRGSNHFIHSSPAGRSASSGSRSPTIPKTRIVAPIWKSAAVGSS